MNKVIFDSAKGPVMLCILEPGNIHKLTHGEPIEFSLNEQGLYAKGLPAKLSIALLYSETPIADSREIAKMVKPKGGVFGDLRTPTIEKTRPHCPECRSTIEQMGCLRNESPIWLIFCTICGCTLGTVTPQDALRKEPPLRVAG